MLIVFHLYILIAVASYQVGMLEIQLSSGDVGDPVIKWGCWGSSYQVGDVGDPVIARNDR